jgi:hypothetical protein
MLLTYFYTMFSCSLVATIDNIIRYSYNKTVKNRSGPVLSNVSFINIVYTPVTESSYFSFTSAAFFNTTVLIRFWCDSPSPVTCLPA